MNRKAYILAICICMGCWITIELLTYCQSRPILHHSPASLAIRAHSYSIIFLITLGRTQIRTLLGFIRNVGHRVCSRSLVHIFYRLSLWILPRLLGYLYCILINNECVVKLSTCDASGWVHLHRVRQRDRVGVQHLEQRHHPSRGEAAGRSSKSVKRIVIVKIFKV